MAPNSTARKSPGVQKKSIPGTQILDWQTTASTRPRVRRPVTACEPCRSAKAKCSGQSNCDRCIKRGLQCKFNPTSSVRGSVDGYQNDGGSNGSTPSLSVVDVPPDSASVDLPSTTFPMANQEIPSEIPAMNGSENWNERALNEALEQFDWVFQDPDIAFNASCAASPNDFGYLPDSHSVELNTNPANISSSGNDTLGVQDTSQQAPAPLPSMLCQCRANMMIHVPKLESAIRQKPKPQLDTMFKLTGEIIQSCQRSTNCSCFKCPVDLVCIMTAFEQTAVCFDYIAKSGFDGTVKVGIGNYCVSRTDDASFKRMLVLDLVSQANVLLDSMGALARDMETQHRPGVKAMGRSPNCLNKLNLNYLQEATASFKKLFRLITDFFDASDRHGEAQA